MPSAVEASTAEVLGFARTSPSSSLGKAGNVIIFTLWTTLASRGIGAFNMTAARALLLLRLTRP
jgi:hypothetical protein